VTPDPEVRKLNQRVQAMERELQALTRDRPDRPRRESSGPAVKDARWNCEKCGSLLAWYDPEIDILRIRYKDHMVYTRVGGVSPTALVDRVLDWSSLERLTIDPEQLQKLADSVAEVVIPGFVQAICRGCGQPNVQGFASAEEIEAGGMG
jgi:hypothetical protein